MAHWTYSPIIGFNTDLRKNLSWLGNSSVLELLNFCLNKVSEHLSFPVASFIFILCFCFFYLEKYFQQSLFNHFSRISIPFFGLRVKWWTGFPRKPFPSWSDHRLFRMFRACDSCIQENGYSHCFAFFPFSLEHLFELLIWKIFLNF